MLWTIGKNISFKMMMQGKEMEMGTKQRKRKQLSKRKKDKLSPLAWEGMKRIGS